MYNNIPQVNGMVFEKQIKATTALTFQLQLHYGWKDQEFLQGTDNGEHHIQCCQNSMKNMGIPRNPQGKLALMLLCVCTKLV